MSCPVCSKQPDPHSLEEARICLERVAADFELVRRIVPPQRWSPMRTVNRWAG